jgi:hypothetical protein
MLSECSFQDASASPLVAFRTAAGGTGGDVSPVMMRDLETEVEMKRRFKVSPRITGASKAVLDVVECRRFNLVMEGRYHV